MQLESSALAAATPVAINTYWPGQGGIYAGMQLDAGITYHVILAEEKLDASFNHADATAWARGLTIDGHSDFELPGRMTGLLLTANLSHRFEPGWHWLSTQYSRLNAWTQYFVDGFQTNFSKSAELRARAFRRFIA